MKFNRLAITSSMIGLLSLSMTSLALADEHNVNNNIKIQNTSSSDVRLTGTPTFIDENDNSCFITNNDKCKPGSAPSPGIAITITSIKSNDTNYLYYASKISSSFSSTLTSDAYIKDMNGRSICTIIYTQSADSPNKIKQNVQSGNHPNFYCSVGSGGNITVKNN